ncbi:hypothetical protein SLS58_000296 [Diplodia intermedia]|uniref:Uncharacterized protein n=1 Tax=Diplodia intermedia TaxID=856260 RepID=A0ABR3U6B8_9PEZI
MQPQSFAFGLESFGSIDWDAEYDELAAVEDTITAQSEPEQLHPEGQEATNTALPIEKSTLYLPYPDNTTSADHTPPAISGFPSQTATMDAMPNEYEDLGQYDAEAPAVADSIPEVNPVPLLDPFATWEHPGWSWSESASWHEWTATSPEVSAWALSPGIQSDADCVIRASRYGDDYAHDDIPRVASVLRRAFNHTYDVSENAGVCFPPLARGFKAVPHRGTVHPREECKHRGAKGLWKRWELECVSPLVPDYIPIGETSQMRNGVYLPQPSRLSDVWTLEDDDMEEPVESSEEEWSCFDSSSVEEDEEADGATPATASVESLPERVVVSTTTIFMKPIPLRPRPSIDSEGEDTDIDDNESDDDDTSIADAIDKDENPPSEPSTLIPSSPHTAVRSCDTLRQDPSPSPKLTGPGITRNMAPDDMASPPVCPALALHDMNAGKKLAPPKTLYSSFVQQYHDMVTAGEDTAEEDDGMLPDPDMEK